MYDEVLSFELTPGAQLIGFADDIALVIVKKQLVHVFIVVNEMDNFGRFNIRKTEDR